MDQNEKVIRHAEAAYLIRQALAGDTQAINASIRQLSSADTDLRKRMIETLRDFADKILCQHLLQCLALQSWGQHRDCDLRSEPEASERIDQALIEFFTVDEGEPDKNAKETVLFEALDQPETQIREAAACLLGLRGHTQVIPSLAETIKAGKMIWKERAIQALGNLKDPASGELLISALSMDRDVIHHAALEALKNLGAAAEPAWQKALHHPDSHIQWHAARGLGELGDPRGAGILAEGLLEDNSAVHWASAEVLAQLGPQVIPAILEVLSRQKLAGSSRQAAYSTLQRVTPRELHGTLNPLLEALSSPGTSPEAQAIASGILQNWSTPA